MPDGNCREVLPPRHEINKKPQQRNKFFWEEKSKQVLCVVVKEKNEEPAGALLPLGAIYGRKREGALVANQVRIWNLPPPLARLGLGRKNGPRPYCGPRAERGGGGATATCGGKAAVVEAK